MLHEVPSLLVQTLIKLLTLLGPYVLVDHFGQRCWQLETAVTVTPQFLDHVVSRLPAEPCVDLPTDDDLDQVIQWCGSRLLSVATREGTRTPEKHERPDQRPRRSSVELMGLEPVTH
jgi:hypothetical protein